LFAVTGGMNISSTTPKSKDSPAQIRTGVKGSKGLYAWPLQSAESFIPPPGSRVYFRIHFTIFI